MKPSTLLTALISALPLATVAGAAAAADACKNVKFTVTNDHFEGREIEIRKIKFSNPHNNGKEQTEDVKNQVCKHGSTCTTDGDNLSNAEKVDLHSFKVVFAYKEHDGQWSKEFVSNRSSPRTGSARRTRNTGRSSSRTRPELEAGARGAPRACAETAMCSLPLTETRVFR